MRFYLIIYFQANPDAYIAVGLALGKLLFHFVYDVFFGDQSLSNFPTLEKLRSLQWDSILLAYSGIMKVTYQDIFILILSTILGVLLVVRQRRMLR